MSDVPSVQEVGEELICGSSIHKCSWLYDIPSARLLWELEEMVSERWRRG